jgi:CheY-like chemotaxis protein
MPASVIARIFEPFFSTKGDKGTGLGLSTVYGITKQSGGHITCNSELGAGTTFDIYFPQWDAAPVAEAAPASTPADASGGTETILLVEDEEMVRGLVKTLLTLNGYRVLTARNGAEAIRVADEHSGRIDLLLTDVVMPGGMGGRDVAERLAPGRPGLKVIFMSGYTDDAIIHHGVLGAETSFIHKPFSTGALARKVREVLG